MIKGFKKKILHMSLSSYITLYILTHHKAQGELYNKPKIILIMR